MRFRTLLLLLPLLLLAGCTLTEWGLIASDAKTQWKDRPPPLPSTNWLEIGLYTATYLAGLVSKSAARGFGKAGKVVIGKLKK